MIVVRSRYILVILFALSGFTGLIYEKIWSDYLKLFLGHAAYAQTLVLALFMGGLSMGSWFCSRYSAGWKNLLTAYAAIEVVIGLSALVFHELFEAATGAAYSHVIPFLVSPVGVVTAKWMLSAILILPQTVLLGMTFPLMTAGVLRTTPEHAGRSISLLYFTNSLGAAAGVLTSGFLLIGLMGMPGTMRFAGLVNIAVGSCVWLIARGNAFPGASPEPIVVDAVPPARGSGYRILLAAAGITGMASFIYEVVWVRMLSLVLGSSTHAFELMLGAFILGLACGALWVRYRIERIGDPIRSLVLVQISMGGLALLTLPLYGNAFLIMQWLMVVLPPSDGGYVLFTLGSGVIALMIMFPAALCAGMTLPLITSELLQRGHGERSIGAVYAANTIGAIIGVLFALHIGMPLIGLKGLLIFGASMDIALGLALLWWTTPDVSFALRPAIATASCAMLLLAAGLFVNLDAYKMASAVYRSGVLRTNADSEILFHKDGKTATVSMLLMESGLSIRTNGKPDAEIQVDASRPAAGDEYTMILLAAIPMAYRPQAQTVANIGFGSGLTTATFLRNEGIRTIDTIEIEPVMIEAARIYGPAVETAFVDRRSRITFDDAKTFFASRAETYDIIVSEPSNPWVSGVAGLFSREFYGIAERHLAENGIFCQWLQLYEFDADLVGSVVKALAEHFSDYILYAANNTDLIIIAGNGVALARPDFTLVDKPGMAEILRRIGIMNTQDIAVRRIGDRKSLGRFLESSQLPANSDYYPILDDLATRARFLHASATELIRSAYDTLSLRELMAGWVQQGEPTEVTPSMAFTATLDIFTAMALRDFYLTGRFLERYGEGPPELEEKAIRLMRLFHDDCNGNARERIAALYAVVGLRMLPYLQPQEMVRVWNRLESGSCLSKFTGDDRKWLTLLKAVGRRDGRIMAYSARVLLAGAKDLSGEQVSYLISSGMVGHLLVGEREMAGELWRAYGNRIPGRKEPILLHRILMNASSTG